MDAGGLQRIIDAGPAWLTGGAYGPEAGAVGIVFRVIVIVIVIAMEVAWIRVSRRPAGVAASPSRVAQSSV